MKRIFLYIGVFLIVFVVAALVFFPFSTVVTRQVDRAIVANRAAVFYSQIDSNPFRTVIRGVTVKNGARQVVELGDITVKYTPLSLISQRATVLADTPYGRAELRHKKGRIEVNAMLDAARIARILDETASGDIVLQLNYDYRVRKGDFTVNSGAFSFQTPLMRFTGDSIKGEGAVEDHIVMIHSLQTTGMAQVKLSGQVRIDPANIARSVMNITGEGTISGLSTRFAVNGLVSAPQFVLQ